MGDKETILGGIKSDGINKSFFQQSFFRLVAGVVVAVAGVVVAVAAVAVVVAVHVGVDHAVVEEASSPKGSVC